MDCNHNPNPPQRPGARVVRRSNATGGTPNSSPEISLINSYSSSGPSRLRWPRARFSSIVLFPYCTRHGFPFRLCTVAPASFPSCQAMSISKPPRARKPRTDPAGHIFGNAGNNSNTRTASRIWTLDFGLWTFDFMESATIQSDMPLRTHPPVRY
jgi:hypothetical protein